MPFSCCVLLLALASANPVPQNQSCAGTPAMLSLMHSAAAGRSLVTKDTISMDTLNLVDALV